MIQIAWEWIVKEEFRGLFELAYGPGGAWSKLFERCPGFRGLTLLRDVKSPQRYLAVEFWDTEAQRAELLVGRQAEYAGLEASLGNWVEARTLVGVFRVLAEATVRPYNARGRSKAVVNRRSTHSRTG